MKQSRAMSAFESMVGTAAGFIINVTLQTIVFPWFGMSVPFSSNLMIGAIFTGASITRGYALRRTFEVFRGAA